MHINPGETIANWMPVKVKHPDHERTVLMFCLKAEVPVWVGYWDNVHGNWRDVSGDTIRYSPTHWADMPAGAKD